MLVALFAPAAHAFCGAYVGGAGDTLKNRSSEVVMARDGDRTTLTLVSDYEGDATEFAMLLPVPQVLGPDDVTVVDPALLDWIDAYSQPRTVAYTCETAFATTQVGAGCGGAMGCSDMALSGDYAGDSMVEAAWSEHGYDFVVLSAEESAGLLDWLDANGFAVPEGGEEILQEYIDGGSFFLAARVSLDTPTGDEPQWLWPIQLSYTSDVFSLPIRIGTISAEDEQEVVVYALTDPETGGEVGISNYPQLEMDAECMLPEDADFSDWYAERLETAHAEQGAGWVREYSWKLEPVENGSYHCDPCTAEAVAPGGSFAPFGRDDVAAHLTRLRLRYTPAEATEDVTLYVSGITGVEDQLKYIAPKRELEALFPYCDTGWADDPGECPDAPVVTTCGVPSVRTSLAAAVAAMAMLRRRRA